MMAPPSSWIVRHVDVFADAALEGNPVAVVHDAEALTDGQMAAFARWTNLAETTFLLTPTDPRADYRVRIWTPTRELPFAGHPTLGTAHAWLEAGGQPLAPAGVVQECSVGLVRLRQADVGWAFEAPPLRRFGLVDRNELAALTATLGLDRGRVDARWIDNGPGWVGLLLPDADAVLALDPTGLASFSAVGVVGRHGPDADTDVEVRAFTSGPGGVLEDPVTGSLNAGFGQWLIGEGELPPRYVASQGTRLYRRGRVYLEQVDGQVWVSGRTTTRILGRLTL